MKKSLLIVNGGYVINPIKKVTKELPLPPTGITFKTKGDEKPSSYKTNIEEPMPPTGVTFKTKGDEKALLTN